MKAFIEIGRSNRKTYRLPFAGSKLSLGRSRHCDISLPEEPDLQAEHLFIVRGRDGCRVEVSGEATSLFTFQGQALRSANIPWGEDIFVNRIRIRMLREQAKTDRKTISARSILVALPILCAGAWLLFGRTPTDNPFDLDSFAPSPLFDRSIDCSQSDLASYRAREAERAAIAKMQRYPFMQQDGVEAVRLISEARDCYRAAGEISQMDRIEKTLDTWTRHLEQDYRNDRLRLRSALVNAQHDEARRTIRILRNMLSHRNDKYTKWLDSLERRLRAD